MEECSNNRRCGAAACVFALVSTVVLASNNGTHAFCMATLCQQQRCALQLNVHTVNTRRQISKRFRHAQLMNRLLFSIAAQSAKAAGERAKLEG